VRTLSKHSRVFKGLLVHSLKRSDAVIAVSDGLKEDTVRLVPSVREKIQVIRNGIDLKSIRECDSSLTHPRKYVLFLGRLAIEKNVKTAIKAFGRIASLIPDVDLLIVGTGQQEIWLKILVSDLGLNERIRFLGVVEREDAYAILSRSEFMILPSYTEGFPIVALEALGAGKMVIGSRVTGIMDVIEAGKNGDLFDPDDVETLATLILKYTQDLDARSALERYIDDQDLSEYDIERLADEHLSVYAEGCRSSEAA